MKIIVLDGYTLNPGDLSWKGFQEIGDLCVFDRTLPHEIVERCSGADIVLTNKIPLTGAILKQLPELKYIGVLATGFNVVDVQTATEQGIVVCNVPDYATHSVMQMVFALLLELCQHVQSHSDSVKEGQWSMSGDFCYWNFPLVELAAKTMGIVGFGNIGKKVADVATAFGMNLLVTSGKQTIQNHRNNFQWVQIEELLERSDVISIHCPLLPETKGLINMQKLKKMKTSAFLINTSRGPIVIEEDLAQALNQEIIAGAGLDVLSIEPPSTNNPLLKAKNCIITPHISWATKEARVRLMDISLENISRFLDGEPIHVVNKLKFI
jgi:glycerate dehydrogenase